MSTHIFQEDCYMVTFDFEIREQVFTRTIFFLKPVTYRYFRKRTPMVSAKAHSERYFPKNEYQ